MKDFLLAALSFFASLAVVLLFILIGWYIVWVAFLSRFKLMRELLSRGDDQSNKANDQSVAKTADIQKQKPRTRRRRVNADYGDDGQEIGEEIME